MNSPGNPNSGYYDRNHRQSAALIRARRPYLFKNAVLGAGITAFTLAVCTSPYLLHEPT